MADYDQIEKKVDTVIDAVQKSKFTALGLSVWTVFCILVGYAIGSL